MKKIATKRTACRIAALFAIVVAVATSATLPAWATDRTWVGGTGTADSPRDINDAANWGGTLDANNDNMLFANESEYTYLTNTHSSDSRTCRVVYFNAGDYSFSGDLTALAVRGGATGKRASVLKKSGDWKLTNDISLGCNDNTTLVFTNESGNVTGTANKDGRYIIGQNPGAYAKLVNLDGTVSLDKNLTLAKTATSTGVVEMVGGTLEATMIVKGNASGSASILLGGGTLRAKKADTFIPSGIEVTVGEGGGTIDNGGYDITIDASLGGADNTGRLHLTGSGTTSLGKTLINNGKIVVDSGTVRPSALHIGENAGNDGLVEVNGGTLNVTYNDLYVGYSGKGTLTINGGTVEVDSAFQTFPGWNSGSSGTINLNGGVFKTKRIACFKGRAYLNFNGGTLMAHKDHSDFIKAENMTVTVGVGGTIDNGGFAITIPAALSGSGSLTFKGSGTTTLSGGVDNYSGVTRVAAGSTPCVSKAIATKLLSNGLVLVGVPELNKTYTILASSSESDDWSSLDLSNVTCPVASEITKEIGDDGKSIVVTVTSLKSGNVWTGAKDSNMSDPDNWLARVVPADGADIDLSAATTVNADLDRTFGAVTMGAGVVTFTGNKMKAESFTDTSKIAVGANSTVTLDGDLSLSLVSSNRNICHWVGDGGKFEVTGDIKVTEGSRVLNPCVESVGTGVISAKGLVNNAGSVSSFRLVRAIAGYHANWLIGENGLSGSKKFAVANSATAIAKIIAATDFTMSAGVTANKALELDTAGHTVTIAADYDGTGATTFSGSGTVAVAPGVNLGTSAITLGARTTLELTATSSQSEKLISNTLNLPTGEGEKATIRINGTRLCFGDHVIATLGNDATTANVELDGNSEALDGRKYSIAVTDDDKIVLNIKPGGFLMIVR